MLAPTWLANKIIATVLLVTAVPNCFDDKGIINTQGTVKVSFSNWVNGSPMELYDATYTNPSGESYTINKFKYYITNVVLSNGNHIVSENESCHLIDQAVTASQNFSFAVDAKQYTHISFLLGVDSIHNVSGAQTGALDPLNDMFWTWNTGYVMAKMEGKSPVSKLPNNRIEYHIGGFSGANNVLKQITLSMPPGKLLEVREGKTSEIKITADFNRWWQNPNHITIAALPICTTPGKQAKAIADNYAGMFTVTTVLNGED